MNKNIWLLGFVSFLTDISSEMIAPLLPLFLASLGGGGVLIGLVGGLGDSVSSILKVFSGYLSDKTGKRKVFVFGGYGLSAATKLMFAYATSAWQFVILRPVERLGKGIRTAPRDAIIAESTLKTTRGRGFGFHRMMDNFGAVVGSVMALILIMFYSFTYQSVFLVAGIIAFLALVPILWLKEKPSPKSEARLRIGLGRLSGKLKLFVLISTVFALGNFTYMFYILRAQDAVGIELGVVTPIILYILMNVVETVFSAPAGVLSDEIGRVNVLLMGYGMFIITSLGFFLATSLPILVILFICYGVALSLIDATERALVSDLADSSYKATALGTYHTSIGLAMLPSGLIAGLLWEAVSPEITFLYGAIMGLAAFFMLLASGIKE